MISVGSRDGRKGVELSFGREEMEETELEEGEACYYHQDDNDDDTTIDPDTALSYIDEKIQDVLGHFQKDFEGGVSAENLGAKFGGYGSFLPVYQRSPSWSHPRSPPDCNHSTSRSPNSIQLEGGRQNSVSSSSASLSARPGMRSSNAMPVIRPPSVNNRVNQDKCVLSNNGEELTSKFEVQKSANLPDQKTLKFRIKVGSDNLSTRKNAEIYCGLGLDVSPSSSLDDSPTDSEGICHDLDIPNESLTSMLQIMTSGILSGSPLISPLSGDVIRLTEKEWLCCKIKSKPMHKANEGNSSMVVNGSDHPIINGKVLGEKKPKLFEKHAVSVEPSNNDKTDSCGGPGVALKKETDIDTLACEELVSNTLKLPLLSNSCSDVMGSTEETLMSIVNSKGAVKSRVKNGSFSDVAEEEPSEHVASQENGRAEKSNKKINSCRKTWESREPNHVDENLVYHKKEVNHKEEKTELWLKNESNASEERKSVNVDVVGTSEQKVKQKVASHNEDGLKLAPGEVHLSSGSKKKSKGNQSHFAQGMEFPEDGLMINPSVVRKSKKTSDSSSLMSKSDSEGLKKGHAKAADRMGQEDHEIASVEMPSVQSGEDFDLAQKRSMDECNGTLKERLISKKPVNLSTSGDHQNLSSNVPRPAGKIPNPDAAPTMFAPLVQEDWVCCDKCQAWRLLPLGTNPESLPEKWLCSMLDWLPGMNHCSISEEQTTSALRALYQAQASIAPDSHHNQHAYPGRTLPVVSSGDARRSTEDYQNFGLQFTANGGKKKCGTKDVMNATIFDSSVQVSTPKKNLQESSKTRSLNEVDHSPLVDEFGYQHTGQPSGSSIDRYADTMKSKTKTKQENDIDGLRSTKKMKTEDVHLKDELGTSDHGGALSKAGPSSNSGLSNSASGKDPQNYSNRSRDSKGDLKKTKLGMSEKPEVQISITSDDGSMHMAKCGSEDPVKKRKGYEHQNYSVNDVDVPLPGAGHHFEGIRENECRKEKKSRVSKFEVKDSTGKNDTVMAGKKAAKGTKEMRMGEDLVSTPSQRSIDAADSSKRDLGSVQPSVAATSSSSKVSGSRRSKASLQEMKGSPVESVSSSPLRTSNSDKFIQARRNAAAKDGVQDARFFTMASPRRSVDCENIGGNDQSGKMNVDNLNVNHNGFHKSSEHDFQGRDMGHVPSVNDKAESTSSPHFAAQQVPDGNFNRLDQGNHNTCQIETSEQGRDGRKRNDSQYVCNGSHSKKSGKGFTSRSKEKTRGSRSEFDNGKIKLSDSFDESSYREKMKAGRNSSLDKSCVPSDKPENNYISKKDTAGKLNRENCKEGIPSKIGVHEGSGARADVISSQDMNQNILQDTENERSSKKLFPDKTGVEVSGRGKSHSLPPSVRGQNESASHIQPNAESKKENGDRMFEHDEISKASKQSKKSERQNGNQSMSSRNLTPSVHKGRGPDAPSPARKDSSSQAVTNAVKEAKDLKHWADRLKNSGSTESTGFYFQAALKFLHGASLLESCGSENTKHNEMIQSMQMYSSTAKLCEFCAHEYEKSKDMAAAALAYKCVEVAYMRVIYTSHTSANRDRNELQAALQLIPTGESPSSSASDIDNLNNPATVDKAVVPKGVGSPQVAGNHVLTARNRSSFMRLINFAQEVNFAMEASRKSRTRLGEAQSREGISSVKRALDFNFQDVDGLLRLVRVAMEAINR